MNRLSTNMRYVWENTTPRNAHLGISGERQEMLDRYKKLVSSRIKVKDMTVIDFGIGGGLLGVHLLSKTAPIARYIGYDLARRSIEKARENLAEYAEKIELNLLERDVWDFVEKHADLIVCLACIFHFPTRVYLDNFLKTCNASGAKYLVLEIRDTGIGTVCRNDPYVSVKRTLMNCDTNETYVTSKLTEYELVDSTDPKESPLRSQILWYKRRDA